MLILFNHIYIVQICFPFSKLLELFNNKCSGRETFFYYFNPFTYVCMAGDALWNSTGAKLWKSMSKWMFSSTSISQNRYFSPTLTS